MPTEKVTYCRICEASCGLVATVDDGRLLKLRPDDDHPLSRGFACPKGIAMTDVQNDPDRVLHPLRRTPEGTFEQVSWDEALDDIGRRLGEAIDAHGGEGIGWYFGNPTAFSYSHILWVQGIAQAIGMRHVYSAGSQDVNNRFVASHLLYGRPTTVPIPDLDRTDFLLVIGANPVVSHGSLISAPRMREQMKAITDPRRPRRRGRPAPLRDRPALRARRRPPRHRRLAAAVAAARHLRAGPRGRPGDQPSVPGDRAAALRRDVVRPGVDGGGHRHRGRHRPRARPRPGHRRQRRGLRPDRLLPGPPRHARRLPHRRARARHRQPRPRGRARLRRPRAAGRGDRPPAGHHDLRQASLAHRRLPRRARDLPGGGDGRGDDDARAGPAAHALRLGRQPGAVGAQRPRARRGAARARPVRLARPLRQRDQQARRLHPADHDLAGARGRAGRVPAVLHPALRAVDRPRPRAVRRGASGVADHRGPRPPGRRLGVRPHPAAVAVAGARRGGPGEPVARWPAYGDGCR